MNFLKKAPKLLKLTCLASLSACAGWCFYQIKRTRDILNHTIDTSVLAIQDPIDVCEEKDESYFVLPLMPFDEPSWSLESFWNNVLYVYAKRLVTLAKSDRQLVRKQAVLQLGNIESLDQHHFEELSQVIDSRTAIGLARTLETDLRIFPEPPMTPLHTKSHHYMVEALRELIINLNEKSEHACLSFFITKVFVDHEDISKFGEADETSTALKSYATTHKDKIPLCLETMAHHASVENNARDIVQMNGLPLLLELYNRYKHNKFVVITIARIISHISRYTEYINDLFKTGWITVLAHWARNEDIRVSLPAIRALANLDPDELNVYQQRVYPLHPQTRSDSKIYVDVVFIHGLLGGVFYTWRQRKNDGNVIGLMGKLMNKAPTISPSYFNRRKEKDTITNPMTDDAKHKRDAVIASDSLSIASELQDFANDLEIADDQCSYDDYEIVLEDLPLNTGNRVVGPFSYPVKKFEQSLEYDSFTNCWPQDWLPEDCNGLRVIGVNYETNLSMWAPVCPIAIDKGLRSRSLELLVQLLNVGVGERPIVWVVHSMGGLIVKNLLTLAAESPTPSIQKLASNSKAVVFYSTPHLGSSMAKLSNASALVIWPTIEVQELEFGAAGLVELHEKFLKVLDNNPMRIISFVEKEPTTISALKFRFLIVEPVSGDPGIGEHYEIGLDHLGICKPACRHSFLYQKVLHLVRTVVKESKNVKVDNKVKGSKNIEINDVVKGLASVESDNHHLVDDHVEPVTPLK